MCYGAGCHVHFSSVSFESSTLVVMAGAHVTINGSTFSQHEASAAGISVYGHGEGTLVQICDSSVSGGTQGIAVHSKAVLEAQKVSVSHGACGFLATEVAQLSMHGCIMGHADSTCVEVRGAATAKLVGCTLSDSREGILCSDEGTQVDAKDCCISNMQLSGALSQAKANLSVHSCTLSGNMHGCSAHGQGAEVSISESTLRTNKQYGVVATSGAKANVSGCHSEASAAGFWVQDKGSVLSVSDSTSLHNSTGFGATGLGATMTLQECKSESDGMGCDVSGELHATSLTVINSGGKGLNVLKGGNATLKACMFARCGGISAGVSGRMSLLSMCECVVYQGCSHGVGLDTSRVVLTECIISQCQGAGVIAAKSKASVTLQQCQLVQNGSGMIAAHGAAAMLDGCQSQGNGNGYEVQSGACITMVDCSSDADTTACRVGANSRLTALNLTVTDSKEACCALSAGIAKFSDSSFTRCGEVAFLGNGASELMLHSCTVYEVHRLCVSLSEGSTGKLTYCTLSRSMAGMKACDQGTALHATNCTVSSCSLQGAAAQFCAELSLCSCTLLENGEGVVGTGVGSRANLEDCTLESHSGTGVLAVDGAQVEVQDSRSRRNGAGFRSRGTGSQLRMSDCSSTQDASGVCVTGGGGIMMEQVTVDGVVHSGTVPTC